MKKKHKKLLNKFLVNYKHHNVTDKKFEKNLCKLISAIKNNNYHKLSKIEKKLWAKEQMENTGNSVTLSNRS